MEATTIGAGNSAGAGAGGSTGLKRLAADNPHNADGSTQASKFQLNKPAADGTTQGAAGTTGKKSGLSNCCS